MNSANREHHRFPLGRGGAALVMLVLCLGLNLFSTSPDLHQLVHPDSRQATHECVFTLFAHGLVVGGGLIALEILPPDQTDCCVASHQQSFPQPSDIRLNPGRAPPAIFGFQQALC